MLSFAACPRGGISVRSDHSTTDGTKPAVTTTSLSRARKAAYPADHHRLQGVSMGERMRF